MNWPARYGPRPVRLRAVELRIHPLFDKRGNVLARDIRDGFQEGMSR